MGEEEEEEGLNEVQWSVWDCDTCEEGSLERREFSPLRRRR